jgi:hypothetical protein
MLDEPNRSHDNPSAVGPQEHDPGSDRANRVANLLVAATVAVLVVALAVIIVIS